VSTAVLGLRLMLALVFAAAAAGKIGCIGLASSEGVEYDLRGTRVSASGHFNPGRLCE
jgi:hypothetical protein